MKSRSRSLFLSLLLAAVFFSILFATLRDYGTSWDDTLHFSRGQVYLNYFLTGKKEYDYSKNERKSFYQIDYQAGDFWFDNNPGHPPINGFLAAVSNEIFYKKLNLLSDINAYHIFNILVSSMLVFVVVFFAADSLGIFAAIISFLVLVTYPLFFAESHFNVKDPAETAFFTATIWCFYKSLDKGSWKWLLSSIIFFSLSLGTKFNILFLPFILIPYLLFRYQSFIFKLQKIHIPLGFILTLILSPVIVAVIFIGSWPMLWNNLPTNLLSVFEYYQSIGTLTKYQPENFYIFGFNTFPILWILFTTPPIVLFLLVIGLLSCLLKRNLKGGVVMLWLLWFFIPILRVTVPKTSIYGGIRQIMEFLPAMALIAGLGATQLLEWSKIFKPRKIKLVVGIVIISLFIWPIFILVKMHPNQNVYFNSLIGGLKGAYEKNFPSWGNSYGNAYLQGIDWLNKNAPINSKVALIQGTDTNAPTILFRPDIKMKNSNWSGLNRNGEYLMDLTLNDTGKAFYYTWDYVDKFLEPVYELKVDNIAILKIWKNDLEHTKPSYRINENLFIDPTQLIKKGNELLIKFPKELTLSRVELGFTLKEGCIPIKDSIVETSLDGNNWLREKDLIPFPQVGNKDNINGNTITEYFAAKQASDVRFLFNDKKSCALDQPTIRVYTF